MTPKQILTLAANRIAKAPQVDEVGASFSYRLPGAIDGYDQGWAVRVTDHHGHVYTLAVTLYSLGIE